jgi:putative Ca2+/H+ antiporter (TMEM165/GDT1 family)
MTALWSSFAVVALAEMGDKTQLVALTLASRYRCPWTIMLGILIATVVNHALAASVGVWIAEALPGAWLAWTFGLGFIAFGFWTLVPDRADTPGTQPRWGPLLTSAMIFFVAEMGDKTQLATLALGARFESTGVVTAGTTLGMLAADGLAVFAGDRLTAIVPMRTVRWIAAALFFAFGVTAIAGQAGLLFPWPSSSSYSASPESAKPCEGCAAPLALLCVNCGRRLSPTAKFCPGCARPTGLAPARPPAREARRPAAREVV